MKPSYCKREHGRGHKLGVNIYFNSVGGKNARCGFGKFVGLYARIVSDCNRRLFKIFVKVVCKPLRRLRYGINIESVCAGADNAAKSARAELKIFIETVENFIFVAFY